MRRTWVHKIYETLAPHFPPLGGALCVDRQQVPEFIQGSGAISRWCERSLQELDPHYGAPQKFLSDVLSCLEVVHRMDRLSFFGYAPFLHSRRLVKSRNDLLLIQPGSGFAQGRSIIHDFIDFYIGKSNDSLKRVLLATQ